MAFDPHNPVVQLCLQGMNLEAEAARLFLQAWNEATNDHEKFLAAWFLARHQPNAADQLTWYQTALQLALNLNDASVKSAYPALYTAIAKCYEELALAAVARRPIRAPFTMAPGQTCNQVNC